MTDVVVTVPKTLFAGWIGEGDVPGNKWDGTEYAYWLGPQRPNITVGERVYIVAYGRLRGYAPLLRIEEQDLFLAPYTRYGLVRGGGAVAVTLVDPIPGFRGFRYRWWPRISERPFPDWQAV